MTSANSSLADFRAAGRRRGQTARRLWTVIFTFGMLLLSGPFATVMLITRESGMYYFAEADAATKRGIILRGLDMLLGLRQNMWMMLLLMLLAIVLSLQGYAYLFSRAQIDFYESQPVSRKELFFRIYWNGITIYLVSCAINLALSLLVVLASGYASAVLCADALLAFVKNAVVFLMFYHIGILAAMLTGTLLFALPAAGFLIGIEFLFAWMIRAYQDIFFHYYVAMDAIPKAYGSPMYHLLSPLMRIEKNVTLGREAEGLTWKHLAGFLQNSVPDTLWMAGIAALAFGLAWYAYRRRRREWAGESICFRRVRDAVKLATVIFGALLVGLAFYIFYGTRLTGGGRIGMGVFIVVGGALICMLSEAVLDRNLKSVRKKLWHVPAVCIAAGLFFVVFERDLTGIDHYIPAPEQVESCALITWNQSGGGDYYDEQTAGYIGKQEYTMRHMFLTNTADVAELTGYAHAYTDGLIARYGDMYAPEDDGQTRRSIANGTVLFRMKNGKEVQRSLTIPEDVDEGLMNRILSDEAYKKGIYQIYNEAMTQELTRLAEGRLQFEGAYGTQEASGALYAEFAEAYRKDLEQYDYTLATEPELLGYVGYYSYGRRRYVHLQYEVYPSYVNTISFLKQNNLYLSPEPPYDEVSSVIVIDNGAELSGNDAWDAEQAEREYTDPEEIREILAHTLPYNIQSPWIRPGVTDDRYDVECGLGSRRFSYSVPMQFRTGEVPAFVKEDLGVSAEDGADTVR